MTEPKANGPDSIFFKLWSAQKSHSGLNVGIPILPPSFSNQVDETFRSKGEMMSTSTATKSLRCLEQIRYVLKGGRGEVPAPWVGNLTRPAARNCGNSFLLSECRLLLPPATVRAVSSIMFRVPLHETWAKGNHFLILGLARYCGEPRGSCAGNDLGTIICTRSGQVAFSRWKTAGRNETPGMPALTISSPNDGATENAS